MGECMGIVGVFAGRKGLQLETKLAGYLEGSVDLGLPAKGHSNSHGVRQVHQIISMIKWIQTSKLSIENSLWQGRLAGGRAVQSP
jgi:hypothetical protein